MMIDNLEDLPALSACWIAPLADVDPELHAELAASIVIGRAHELVTAALPAGAAVVLSVVDLRGKEIGAFHFAPANGATAIDQIEHYDRAIRARCDADTDLVFIGDYGAGMIFLSPQGVGLWDASIEPPRITGFSSSFGAFVLAQANAFDAYKKFIVKQDDARSYRALASACASLPALRDTDVAAIYDAQLIA